MMVNLRLVQKILG